VAVVVGYGEEDDGGGGASRARMERDRVLSEMGGREVHARCGMPGAHKLS
jgi:hypothetical protein